MIPPDLDALAEPFRAKARLLQDRIERDGLPFVLFEARRTFTRQAELYAQGRIRDEKGVWRVIGGISTKAMPGQSPHNWGYAVDFVLDPAHSWWGSTRPKGPWDLGDKDRPLPKLAWERYGRLVRETGLRAGMDWTWKDWPHAELPGWEKYRPKDWPVAAQREIEAGR